MLGSSGMFHLWALAVFLLCSPVPLYGRPIAALSHRTRRSVSHAQLMHDKGRALQEFKRRLWLQELLDQVHTADEPPPPPPPNRHAHGGTTLHQKPPGGSKHLPLTLGLDGGGGDLPQETSVWAARKDQPLKPPAKRKKKVKSGRRRESEKRRRRARSVRRRESEKRRRRARSVGRRESEKRRRRARSVRQREGEKRRRRARSVSRRESEKRKRRARSVRQRESEKRRRRARSVGSLRTQESVRTRGLGSQTGCGLRAALH